MSHPKRHFYRGKKRKGRFERGRRPPKIKAGADVGLKKVFAGIGVPAQKPFKPDAFQLQALSAVKRSDCLVDHRRPGAPGPGLWEKAPDDARPAAADHRRDRRGR